MTQHNHDFSISLYAAAVEIKGAMRHEASCVMGHVNNLKDLDHGVMNRETREAHLGDSLAHARLPPLVMRPGPLSVFVVVSGDLQQPRQKGGKNRGGGKP